MTSEIQPADPAARRRFIAVMIAIALAGTAAYFGLQAWLADLRAGDPADARQGLERALLWGSWAIAAPVLGLAAFLWRSGTRTRRAGRFPPPGARVIRDTPVLTGESARTRGIVLEALAAILFLSAAAMLVSVHRLVAILEPP